MDPTSDDLSPLPAVHRQGLIAVAVLAALSFVSSTVVLLYLTVKLVRWHLRTRKRSRNATAGLASPPVDLALGLAERHYMGDDDKHPESVGQKKAHPNQFLVLIYNLLLADIHQAASFLLNAVWVGRNGIEVQTATCWVQGWLVQTGDLAGSLFITAIALHTYLAVVWNYTPPQSAVYITVIFLWAFNYLLMIIGIAMTGNGKDAGGFFVRASAWVRLPLSPALSPLLTTIQCWINIRYEGLRLYLHYLWIFISLAITSILYTLIFLSLRKRRAQPQPRPPTTDSTTTIHATTNSSHTPTSSITDTTTTTTKHPSHTLTHTTPLPAPQQPHDPNPSAAAAAAVIQSHGGHNLFLLYPLIYIACTLPLALGRIATMAGAHVPIAYFCTAGALITSNGWLDVLLWGATRHTLLFGADVDTQESGLESFAFMRTPHGRRWGNIVWVEGGGGGGNGTGDRKGAGDKEEGGGRVGRWVKGRMGWRQLGFGGGGSGGGNGNGAGEKEGRVRGREEGLAIQMDMVTTVVVEPAEGALEGKAWGRRSPHGHGHAVSGSVGSRGRLYETDAVP